MYCINDVVKFLDCYSMYYENNLQSHVLFIPVGMDGIEIGYDGTTGNIEWIS